jgi:NAD+ synthase (glutamine-hydrolysing)
MIYEGATARGERALPDGLQAVGRGHRPDRLRQSAWPGHLTTTDAAPTASGVPHRRVRVDPPDGDIALRRKVDRFPFVPDDPERLALDCFEAYNIQVSGLEQRLRAIGNPKVVIGPGGLDSRTR